jgi:hypothetical protein
VVDHGAHARFGLGKVRHAPMDRALVRLGIEELAEKKT